MLLCVEPSAAISEFLGLLGYHGLERIDRSILENIKSSNQENTRLSRAFNIGEEARGRLHVTRRLLCLFAFVCPVIGTHKNTSLAV